MTPGRRVERKDKVFGEGEGEQSNAKAGAQMVSVKEGGCKQ